MDADYWKSWAHQRLNTPTSQPAALTLFKAPSQEHLSLAKHLTAERKTEEFVAGKGVVTRWERNADAPLDKESRTEMQRHVDRYYRMFVESVARNGGTTVERIES
jgi:hypothetical protein